MFLGTIRSPCVRSGQLFSGGEGGIRTHGTREGSTVFETARFNRSRTSPGHVFKVASSESREELVENAYKPLGPVSKLTKMRSAASRIGRDADRSLTHAREHQCWSLYMFNDRTYLTKSDRTSLTLTRKGRGGSRVALAGVECDRRATAIRDCGQPEGMQHNRVMRRIRHQPANRVRLAEALRARWTQCRQGSEPAAAA